MKFSRFISLLIGVMMMGLGVAMIANPPVSEAAFGTSPPWVRNDHLLPGTTFEQIINLSRNEATMDMQVKTRIEGDKEVVKWLKIENEDQLIMRAGVTSLPMKVIVKVPRKAALKDYRGGIFVTLESIQNDSAQQGGNVAIKLGAHILVELSVIGDKVTEYRIKSITLDPMNFGDFFHLNVEVQNVGNTEITDLTGQIDIYNKQETEIIKTLTFGKLTDAVSPDDLIKSRIDFSNLILDPGEYWVVVKVFKDNQTIYENRLYQKVNEQAAAVVTPEDVGVKKPSLPKLPVEEEVVPIVDESLEGPVLKTEQPVTHEAAPATQPQTNTLFVTLGIVGISFGLLAMIAIIILLIILIKNQRQAAIQRYLTEQKFHNE